MKLRFHTLDVFTNRKFAGNPLVLVRDCDGLAGDEMQKIAREFNLSETAFLLEPRDPINTARIRIFTPFCELAFAGHPTIGAAALIAKTRAGEMLARHGVVIALEQEIGTVRCEVREGRRALFAQFCAPKTPVRIGDAPHSGLLAKALSLQDSDIGFDGHVPSVYSAGLELVFVPLTSREALDRAQSDPAIFAGAMGGSKGAYLYTRETEDDESAVHARMFANGLGFVEDPATGSAAAAFAGVAHEFEAPEDGDHQLFIEQGHKMGRPSRLTLRMSVEGGRLTSVHVGGHAVMIAEGELHL